MNTFQIAVICLMVATGTLNTVSAGLQLARAARNKIGEFHYFEHYFVQTFFMMLGECLCLVVYGFLKYVVYRKNPEKVDGDALPMNPLVLWPAAMLDIVATTLGYFGLGFMRSPGFFQMLRVSPIVFCGLISMPVLKQKLKIHNWLGILVIGVGICIKALPYVLPYPSAGLVLNPDDIADLSYCRENLTDLTGADLTTLAPELGTAFEDWVEQNGMIVGILLVLVGEFFHGCQFVYEEKYLTKYKLSPLKCVGLEGLNGVITLMVLLWPLYFIKIPKPFGLGPENRMEDAIDAFTMIFDGHNGGWLLAWTVGNMFSIAVFNFAGITVMRELNATTRAVLDQLRIIFIWIIFLLPLGPYLCRLQDRFDFAAPIGLAILVVGVFIYLDVIIMPTIRKFMGKNTVENIEEKESENTVENIEKKEIA